MLSNRLKSSSAYKPINNGLKINDEHEVHFISTTVPGFGSTVRTCAVPPAVLLLRRSGSGSVLLRSQERVKTGKFPNPVF